MPFDPNNPGLNLIAMDDDGNTFPNGSLTGRQITLVPHSTYYLVVANYSEIHKTTGDYELVLRDALTLEYSLADAITLLQLMTGSNPHLSSLGRVTGLVANSEPLTIGDAILVLQDVAN